MTLPTSYFPASDRPLAIKSPTVNVTPKPGVVKVFAFSFTLLVAVGIVECSAKGATNEVAFFVPVPSLDLKVDGISEEASATGATD